SGARVINLSLGGVRDPADPQLDTYSALEQAAVEYAYGKGAVVVAAVGNGQESPSTPWRFADYPAALPHVIGVSAVGRLGGVPPFSNRDPQYVDIAAPGVGLLSTIPRNLIDRSRPACADQPYSSCGPFEFRNAIGTSFAAPQVSAAAALLLGADPKLTPDQVSWLLERTAVDASPSDGCAECAPRRDAFTGWGRLDVDAALTALAAGHLPPPDVDEPNDNAGASAYRLRTPKTIVATLDFWDDPVDVYAIPLHARQRLFARLTPLGPAQTTLVLWKPGTVDVNAGHLALTGEAARSLTVGLQQRLAYTPGGPGVYYVEVKLVHPTRNPVAYRLAVAIRG